MLLDHKQLIGVAMIFLLIALFFIIKQMLNSSAKRPLVLSILDAGMLIKLSCKPDSLAWQLGKELQNVELFNLELVSNSGQPQANFRLTFATIPTLEDMHRQALLLTMNGQDIVMPLTASLDIMFSIAKVDNKTTMQLSWQTEEGLAQWGVWRNWSEQPTAVILSTKQQFVIKQIKQL